MRIGICDGDQTYRDWLEREIEKNTAIFGDRVEVYANGSDLLDALYASTCVMDLLLIDLNLPLRLEHARPLSGMATALEALQINPKMQVVVITDNAKYALEGYRLRSSNYLIKPVSSVTVIEEINRARQTVEFGKVLRVRTKDSLMFIPHKSILYIECSDYILNVHTTTGIYPYTERMGKICDDIDNPSFCRIHRSFLVNLRHAISVNRLEKNVRLYTGQTLPVSEKRIIEVLEVFDKLQKFSNKTGIFKSDKNDSHTDSGGASTG